MALDDFQELPKLVIVGQKDLGFDPLSDNLSKHKSKHDFLLKNIIFKHFVHEDDLPSVYSGAFAFIFPSLYEGFGFPPLEAMACGTAVIGTANGGARELITDGENGLLVHPSDTEKCAELITKVLKDNFLRANLAQKGRETVKGFSSEKMVRETLEIYQQVDRFRSRQYSARWA